MSRLILSLVFCLILVAMTGCTTFPEVEPGPVSRDTGVKSRGHGPPPHAPAHGYRHKYKHHTLEYDDEAGAYVVIHLPGTYFYDGLYMRLSESGRWYVSAALHGGWRVAVGNEVPARLKTYKKKSKKQKYKKHKKKY